MNKSLIYDNLAIKGGGIKGYAYPSAIFELHKHGILQNIKRIAGSSAGAIIAGFLACGATTDDLFKFMEVDFSKFKDDDIGFFRDFYRLYYKFGYCPGKKFSEWYKSCLKKLTGNKNISFEIASNLYNKDLYVTGTNLSKGKLEIFNPMTTPQMRIWEAVRISMSIPLFFVPWKYNNNYYVDGGLLCNFFNFPEGNTLGLYLIGANSYRRVHRKELKNLKAFVGSIIDIMMFQLENQYIDKDLWENTIKINTDHLSATDFDLTNEQKEYLMMNGKLAVSEFIVKKLKE